jgi:hypothetical protein
MRSTLLPFSVPLFVLLAGCQCGPLGVESTRFSCSSDADCVTGFECRDLGQGAECVRAGTVVEEDAGADAAVTFDAGADDAGTPDAGEPDAGELDAGDVDAGEMDAGEPDAGEVDAGEVDAGFDAGIDAGVDAGTPDAGPPPTQLVFTTAAQSLASNSCSTVMTVETRSATNVPTNVQMTTPLTLAASPGSTVTFYSNQNCAGGGTTSATIATGGRTASFYARGTAAGAFNVVVSATGLTSASQQLLVDPPNRLVFTSTPPSPVRGGTCLPASVEAQRGTVATIVGTNTTIGLTASPTGGARFFADASCNTAITTVQMAAGSSTTAFFIKPLTGGVVNVSAAASFGTAMQTLNVTPIVRRGQCNFSPRVNLADGGVQTDLSVACSVTPPVTDLTAVMLWTQTTGVISGTELGSVQARCRLSSTSQLACVRRQDQDGASVHFQIAEVPSGLLVQRSTTSGCTPSVTLPTAVNTSKTFVLKTSANGSSNFDDEDTLLAELRGPTSLVLAPNSCEGYDVQAVQWEGVTVERGFVDGGFPDGAGTLTVTGLPGAGLNRALLTQPHAALDGARPLCSTLVRGAMPSSSSLAFSRGVGDAGCPLEALESIHYERIDFGNKATVREYSATFAPGAASRTVTVSGVDPTRTVVFSASQISGGQGAGESDGAQANQLADGLFQLVLTNSTTVTVTRAQSTSAAAVTFYVAELAP